MEYTLKVLVVDDEPNILNTMQLGLESKGYQVVTAISGEDALEQYRVEKPDVVLLDLKLTGMDGMEVLRHIKNDDERTQVIMMTAYGSVKNAVNAMKIGAYDYITKPSSLDEVHLILRNVGERFKLFDENCELRQQLRSRYKFDSLIGTSPAMQKVYALMEQVIETDSTVLITGETGTGKEVIARAIHYNSNRGKGPFQAIHCAGIQESLLENELFGHEKGAFTGADTRKKGLFEIADKGSVLLDEISETPSIIQAKLLRVLQEREYLRVGGTAPVKIDVRLIAATNVPLEDMVDAGTFRRDLYYRVNVVPIVLPPLRDRKEDVPLLANYFLHKNTKRFNKKITGISKEAFILMGHYDWPGNVRELENAIEHGINLCRSEILSVDDFPVTLRGTAEKVEQMRLVGEGKDYKDARHEFERVFIINALRECGGNVTRAAELSGLPRGSFQKIMRRYNIKSEQFRG